MPLLLIQNLNLNLSLLTCLLLLFLHLLIPPPSSLSTIFSPFLLHLVLSFLDPPQFPSALGPSSSTLAPFDPYFQWEQLNLVHSSLDCLHINSSNHAQQFNLLHRQLVQLITVVTNQANLVSQRMKFSFTPMVRLITCFAIFSRCSSRRSRCRLIPLY